METSKKSYKRFQYDQESLDKALKSVATGELSLCKASAAFNIPKSTLSNKINHKVPWVRQMGPPPELIHDEEKMLAKWITNKAKLGFPMHPNDVFDTVETFLNENNRQSRFLNNRPGKKWLQLFLQRHPDISKRNAETISKARAAVTEDSIRRWFSELKTFLKDENYTDILNDPSRIFNADETGVMTNPKTGIILGPKNYKNTYEIANSKEKESITVLCTFAADGKDVPPFIVYPYKRIPAAVINNHPDSWMIGRSDSGWMVSETFHAYIKLFYEWLVKENIQLPVLLFLDGHKSHINLQMFEFCNEKGIILFCLHPNATHILQPCDVAIFRPIKNAWKDVVRKHKQNTTAPINRQNFANKFKEAYEKGLKPTTITNGFRTCGLYPLDPDAVDYSKCIASRRQEIAAENNIPVDDHNDYKKDMRTTMKVIESEVDLNIRKEFIQFYQTKKTHDHPYFKLWKKCKSILENQCEPIQNVTSSIDLNNTPLDLSASSTGSNHRQLDSRSSGLNNVSDTQTPVTSQMTDVFSPREVIVAEVQSQSTNANHANEILTFPDSVQSMAEINLPHPRRLSSSPLQNEVIQITEVVQIHATEDSNRNKSLANQKYSSAIFDMQSEPSLLFNETDILGHSSLVTEELIELLLDNDPIDSSVIPLPWYNSTQLDTAPRTDAEPISTVADIVIDSSEKWQKCGTGIDLNISIDQTSAAEIIPQDTIETAISPVDHIIVSPNNLKTPERTTSSLEKYLTYPKIASQKKNINKKEPTAPRTDAEPISTVADIVIDSSEKWQKCGTGIDLNISIDQTSAAEIIPQDTIETAISPVDHIIVSPNNLKTPERTTSSLEKYLTYPKIASQKKNINKKEPMPYGLTGQKYKKFIEKKQEEKKRKEDELNQRRKEKQEAIQLRREKQKEKAALKQDKQKRRRNTNDIEIIENQNNENTEPKKRKKQERHDNKSISRPKKLQKRHNSQSSLNQSKTNVDGELTSDCDWYYDSSQSKCGKYAIVRFNTQKRRRYFVGKILAENDEEKKYKVEFLRKKSAVNNVITFVKPQVQDVAEVDYNDIERLLQEPTCSRRGLYSFADVSFTDIE